MYDCDAAKVKEKRCRR